MAILGALTNKRPHYNQYPPAAYPPTYHSPGYSPYSPYSRPSYPQHTLPSYPQHPPQLSYAHSTYHQPQFPAYYGGYPYGRQLAKSGGGQIPESNEKAESLNQLTTNEYENGSDDNSNTEEVENKHNLSQENVEITFNESEIKKPASLEQLPPIEPIINQQHLIPSDNNGVVLYPTLLQGPMLLPPQPTYLLPHPDQYYSSAPLRLNTYHHPQLIPTNINGISLLLNYRPQFSNVEQPTYKLREGELQLKRLKRNSQEDKATDRDEIIEDVGSDIATYLESKDDEGLPPNESIEVQESISKLNTDRTEQKKQDKNTTASMAPIPSEGRKKKKKPSKGTLLAVGLLGAAAGYALTNTGIKSYYNRPPQYQYPPSYQVATAPYYSNYPPSTIGGYQNPPRYANNFPRPQYSPYYYPLYRSLSMDNEEMNQNFKGNQLSGNRSPYIIISTQQKPSRPINQFPYNHLLHYQQYQQLSQQKPNRIVYVYGSY